MLQYPGVTKYATMTKYLKQGKLWLPPFPDMTQTVSGSGATSAGTELRLTTGITASSTARRTCSIPGGFSIGASNGRINWAKKLIWCFDIMRTTSEAETVVYCQIKTVSTQGILASHGIGLVIANYALTGESHDGTTRQTASLATTLTDSVLVNVRIEWNPAVSVEFFVNTVSKGILATNLPSGTQAGNLVLSIENGVTGGTNAILDTSVHMLWQNH